MDFPGFRAACARMTSASRFGGLCLGFLNFEGRLPLPSAAALAVPSYGGRVLQAPETDCLEYV